MPFMLKEYFGVWYGGRITEFWGLGSDKPFVVKPISADRFMGYCTLAEAQSAKKPDEDIFQFHNGGWRKILFPVN